MRDVTKILSDSDLLKLKALLSQTPDKPIDPDAFEEYPKMLFDPGWLVGYRLIQNNTDPLIVKEAKEKMKMLQVIVWNIDEEEEYLLDGWKADPNVFIIEENIAKGMKNPDPRVPIGREGRRAAEHAKLTRQQELAQIRRRFAELTGKRLSDEPEAEDAPVMVASEPIPDVGNFDAQEAVNAALAGGQSKHERVKAAAKRATHAHA